MKLILTGLALSALILTAISCKKTDNEGTETKSGTENLAPFFQIGKGFRHVRTVSEPTAGFVSFFNSLDLSFTDDGKLHWVYDRHNPFAKTRFLYRSTLNASTGDTIPTTGKPVGQLAPNYSWANNPQDLRKGDFLAFVPYTSNLYLSYQSHTATFSASGDVPRFDYVDYSFNRQPAVYPNGDVCMSFIEMTSSDIARSYQRLTTFVWHNGVKVKGAGKTKTVWTYMNKSLDSLWHKGIGFPTGRGESLACTFDEHNVYLFDSNEEIVGQAPFSGQKFPDVGNAYAADIKWFVKSSKDMSSTTLLCVDVNRKTAELFYSTFIIDNASKKIVVGVNNAPVVANTAYDFDLSGNVYYATVAGSADEETSVRKISVSGATSTVGAGFAGRQLVNKLYAINGKVYIALLSTATEGSNNVARITLLESN